MNLAQMKSQVRDNLMAGGGSNTILAARDEFWADEEVNTALNIAQDKVWSAIRRARSDYFTRVLRSTDAITKILGQSFNPTTLAWVDGTGNYTLPPDFMRMKMITDLDATSPMDRIKITMSDIAYESFRVLMAESSSPQATRDFYADVIAARTLMIRPIPTFARNWEFIYERKLPKLRDWSTGTASVVLDSPNVVFSASADVLNRMDVGSEVLIGTASAVPTVIPSYTYGVIKTLDTATQITMQSNWLDANLSSVMYIVSPVSEIPEAYHDLIVAYAVRELFKKSPNPSPDSMALWDATVKERLADLIMDVEIRQGMDSTTSQAYLEDNYGNEVWL